MDLGQMPWGPFDALGKRLDLLLPVSSDLEPSHGTPESKVERALRHVEHAADRCGEFAQLANGNQDLWLRSQETWEWIRKYLTSLWVKTEVEGRIDHSLVGEAQPSSDSASDPEPHRVPSLPGAAATLRVAARALRSTPLAAWRENLDPLDPDAPTREEAVQTLLGVARVLDGEERSEAQPDTENLSESKHGSSPESTSESDQDLAPQHDPAPKEGEEDPDQVSFDFAKGYDEGYQMGRRVGLALGSRPSPRSKPRPG
jgi:hypothetical protein